MGTTTLATSDEFSADQGAIQEVMRQAVVPEYARKKDHHWEVWEDYCKHKGFNLYLVDNPGTVEKLQVFAHRYKTRQIAPSKRAVKSAQVADALTSVGPKHKLMGLPAPQKTIMDSIALRIQQLLKSYSKSDEPPVKVKPLLVCIVMSILNQAATAHSVTATAIGNVIAMAFYFCLRPSEYTRTVFDNQALVLTMFIFTATSNN